jgi:hypothetical protein
VAHRSRVSLVMQPLLPIRSRSRSPRSALFLPRVWQYGPEEPPSLLWRVRQPKSSEVPAMIMGRTWELQDAARFLLHLETSDRREWLDVLFHSELPGADVLLQALLMEYRVFRQLLGEHMSKKVRDKKTFGVTSLVIDKHGVLHA